MCELLSESMYMDFGYSYPGTQEVARDIATPLQVHVYTDCPGVVLDTFWGFSRCLSSIALSGLAISQYMKLNKGMRFPGEFI